MADDDFGATRSAHELTLGGIVDGEILRARLEALVCEADIHFLTWLDRLLAAALADPAHPVSASAGAAPSHTYPRSNR